MTRTTWRVLWTEMRRGVAPVALAVLAGAGAAMLFNETEDWMGRWGAFAEYVRLVLNALAPIAVALGAWHAGREARRRLDELLATSSRPPWQRMLASWGGVATGACLGLVLAGLPSAVLVARVATYDGGYWWLLLVGALVLVATSTAVGFVVGRTVSGRVAAPVAGVLAFAALNVAGLGPGVGVRPEGSYLPWTFQVVQIGWFAALGAAAIIAAGARRRWLVAVPGVAAVAFAVPLVLEPPAERWQEDPVAVERVCAGDEPEVCTTRESAFLLDDLASSAHEALALLMSVPAASSATIETTFDWDRLQTDDSTSRLMLTPYVGWNGSLSPTTEYGDRLADELLRAAVPNTYGCRPDGESELEAVAYELLYGTALAWAGIESAASGFIVDEDGTETPMSSLVEPMADRLDALTDEEQRAWMGRYVEAAPRCNDQTLRALSAELM